MAGKLLLVFACCLFLGAADASRPPTFTPPRHSTETIAIRVSEGTMLSFDVSPDGKSLAFDLLGQLWLLPANGGEARPITDAVRDTAEDLDPVFSPDGKQIVFRAERRGRTGLWLLDLQTQQVRQLTQLTNPDAFEGSAAWSADGNFVTFTRPFIPDAPPARPGLRVAQVEVASGTVRELRVNGLPTPDMRELSWSSDGKQMVFIAGNPPDGRGRRVWIAVADSGHATPVTAEALQARAPIISRDGRSLAFLAPDSLGRFQVWTQDINGSATRVTNHADVAPTRVRWSADGKSVLYSADGKLWSVRKEGGTPSNIPFTAQLSITRPRVSLPAAVLPMPGRPQRAHAFAGLALSPDAKDIAAIALMKLWIIPVGGAAHAVTDVPHTARHLTWSPDGSEVAWSAGAWLEEDIFATNVKTGATRQITKISGRESLPSYSPDGKHLAFVHMKGEAASLRIVDPQASVTDTAQTRSLGSHSPSWVPASVQVPQWSTASDALLTWRGGNGGPASTGLLTTLSGTRDTLKRFPDAPIFLSWINDSSIVFVRHDRLWQARFDRTGMQGQPRPLNDDPALYASSARDGSILYMSEDGLRLRVPSGSVRHVGRPISYTPSVGEPLLIRNARIVDGSGADATSPQDILIERGRIRRIAAPGTVSTKGKVIDARGRFAIPGLMDLHAHNELPQLLPGFLYFGVTLVRDQGSLIGPLVAYSDAIAAGALPGPRVSYGGFQYYSDWAFDEEQWRGIEPEADAHHVQRSVALATAFGAQHIKTRTFRRWDINARMIAEAHRRGMRATGHCSHPLPIVAAGMDAKEHIGFCSTRGTGPGNAFDMMIYDDVIRLFAAAHIAVIPTISYMSFAARLHDQPHMFDADTALLPLLMPFDSSNWMISMTAPEAAQFARAAQQAREVTAKLARAGVTIGAGTDIWQVPAAVHMELEELVAAGLSPIQAIHAATGAAAQIIGAEKDLGTIAVGKLADIVLLDGDPVADIRNSRRIWEVVQGGRVVDRAAILRDFKQR